MKTLALSTLNKVINEKLKKYRNTDY